MNIAKSSYLLLLLHLYQRCIRVSASLPQSNRRPFPSFNMKISSEQPSFSDSKFDNSKVTFTKNRIPDALSIARLIAIPFFVVAFIKGEVVTSRIAFYF